MKFLVAQIVHLRVIAIRVGDSLQDLITLTGGGKRERHQVWEQGPILITPWEHRRYIIRDHVTRNGACRETSLLYLIKTLALSPHHIY